MATLAHSRRHQLRNNALRFWQEEAFELVGLAARVVVLVPADRLLRGGEGLRVLRVSMRDAHSELETPTACK